MRPIIAATITAAALLASGTAAAGYEACMQYCMSDFNRDFPHCHDTCSGQATGPEANTSVIAALEACGRSEESCLRSCSIDDRDLEEVAAIIDFSICIFSCVRTGDRCNLQSLSTPSAPSAP